MNNNISIKNIGFDIDAILHDPTNFSQETINVLNSATKELKSSVQFLKNIYNFKSDEEIELFYNHEFYLGNPYHKALRNILFEKEYLHIDIFNNTKPQINSWLYLLNKSIMEIKEKKIPFVKQHMIDRPQTNQLPVPVQVQVQKKTIVGYGKQKVVIEDFLRNHADDIKLSLEETINSTQILKIKDFLKDNYPYLKERSFLSELRKRGYAKTCKIS